MSGDDDPLGPPDHAQWFAGWLREWAAGERFGEHASPQRVRPSAKMLRQWCPDDALVDILCDGKRHHHIMRVAKVDGVLEALWNVTQTQGGHWAYNKLYLSGVTTLAVECRCGSVHSVSSVALQRLARECRPGKPKVVGVADVLAPDSG